jgi:hypothetical protein
VRADKAEESVVLALNQETQALAELDKAHQEVAADIQAVEAQLKVLRAMEDSTLPGPAGPAREAARWEAVSSMHLGARLLCMAADMLAKTGTSEKANGKIADAKKALSDLDTTLEGQPTAAPIVVASQARVSCQSALTEVRRSHLDPNKATGSADALLEELSKLGQGTPQRDDRGVFVTLRGIFQGEALSAAGQAALDAIGEVGKRHPRFPVIVVVHDNDALSDANRARGNSRGEKVVGVLRTHVGDARVGEPQLAGNAAPVVATNAPGASRNQRIEVIFVSPDAL